MMHSDSPPKRPKEPFFSLLWHVFSGMAVAALFVTLIVLKEIGLAFLGLTILVAGHTISRAIRGYK